MVEADSLGGGLGVGVHLGLERSVGRRESIAEDGSGVVFQAGFLCIVVVAGHENDLNTL